MRITEAARLDDFAEALDDFARPAAQAGMESRCRGQGFVQMRCNGCSRVHIVCWPSRCQPGGAGARFYRSRIACQW
jgi:hypothetical protein